ncbi:MAG: hypothetical protein Fues2KO_00980 [Fuerstiella sp.]
MDSVHRRLHSEAVAFREERLLDGPDLRLATITTGTSPGVISVLRDRMLQGFQDFGVAPDSHPQACMAIEEALANAVFHGNLELDSKLKEDGSSQFLELGRSRAAAEPWCSRQVMVIELATPFGLWLTIADQGGGFDVCKALQRPTDPEELLASGRGLVMMQAFADDLIFNSQGNEVTLVFYSRGNQEIRELLRERARARATAGPKSLF